MRKYTMKNRIEPVELKASTTPYPKVPTKDSRRGPTTRVVV
jgi:hypothetical protein